MSEEIKNINLDPNQVQKRGFKERLFYAVLFELLGIVFSSLIVSLFLENEIKDIFVITILMAIFALCLNLIYNYLFDWWLKSSKRTKTSMIRLLHMIGFEVSLTLFSLPVIAYYLGISWFNALLLDMGFTIFFMIFTYLYNWAYDHVRVLVFKYFILKD